MKNTFSSALILTGACALLSPAYADTNLVNDTFTGGTGADTTTYPRWSTAGATPLTYTQPTDAFTITAGASANANTDRIFSRSFTETTLGANETLTLTFDFTPGAGNAIYRFGLYDVGVSSITDGSLQTTPTTKDGYYAFYGSGQNGTVLRRETVASGTSVVEAGTTASLGSNTTAQTFASTLVSVVLTITNTGTAGAPNISITSELHSGAGGTGSIIYSLTGSQTTGGLAKFDTIFFLEVSPWTT